MKFPDWLFVFVGSGLGGVLRYTIGQIWKNPTDGSFPWSTFSINLLASGLAAWVLWRLPFPQGWETAGRLLLVTGFCGGFSTFSTFSVENVRLWQSGNGFTALLYSLGSLLAGIGLAAWFYTQKGG